MCGIHERFHAAFHTIMGTRKHVVSTRQQRNYYYVYDDPQVPEARTVWIGPGYGLRIWGFD